MQYTIKDLPILLKAKQYTYKPVKTCMLTKRKPLHEYSIILTIIHVHCFKLHVRRNAAIKKH